MSSGHPYLRSIACFAMVVLVIGHAVHTAPTQAAASALVAQAASPSAWDKTAYRVEWVEAHVPQEVAANLVLAVPVTLRNGGNRVWPASVVLVGYHWFRDHKLVVWDGERTRLPRDLRAGGRATLAARVKTPTEPGAYVLQLTLVHENTAWFENMGANTVVRPVVVRTTTESLDCGDNGSTSCLGER